jgi:methyl-accepting chemotaxis protein
MFILEASMTRGENRKFIFVVFLSFFIVLLGIVITTLAFSISAINDNADDSIAQYKELVRGNIASELQDFSRLLRNPNIDELLRQGTGGDNQRLVIALFTMLKITLGEPYYLILESGGEVVDSKLPEEIGKVVPQDVSMQGSRIVDEFRGNSGELVMVAAPLSEDVSAAVVVDITGEIEEARQPFEHQKTDALLVSLFLFMGFLIISTLVVFFIITWANSRYISGPIKELEDKAKRIMEGDSSIQVTVDEESDYYALQALLDSMQRMLMEMESRSEE